MLNSQSFASQAETVSRNVFYNSTRFPFTFQNFTTCKTFSENEATIMCTLNNKQYSKLGVYIGWADWAHMFVDFFTWSTRRIMDLEDT